MNTIHLEVMEKLLIGVVAVAGQQLVSSMYNGLMDFLHISKLNYVKFGNFEATGFEEVWAKDVKFIARMSDGSVKIVSETCTRIIAPRIILETK